MPRRRSSYYGHDSALRYRRDEENGGLILTELDRANFLGYVLVGYTIADGPEDDIATLVERRVAIFEEDKLPDDPLDLELTAEKAHYAYGTYEGLPKAELDNKLDTAKERDQMALDYRQESEALLQQSNQSYLSRVEGVTFQQFLDAVAKVKDNDEDEESWELIDKWRTRKLRSEERVL